MNVKKKAYWFSKGGPLWRRVTGKEKESMKADVQNYGEGMNNNRKRK